MPFVVLASIKQLVQKQHNNYDNFSKSLGKCSFQQLIQNDKNETYIQNLGDYFLKGYLLNKRSFIYLSFLEKKHIPNC